MWIDTAFALCSAVFAIWILLQCIQNHWMDDAGDNRYVLRLAGVRRCLRAWRGRFTVLPGVAPADGASGASFSARPDPLETGGVLRPASAPSWARTRFAASTSDGLARVRYLDSTNVALSKTELHSLSLPTRPWWSRKPSIRPFASCASVPAAIDTYISSSVCPMTDQKSGATDRIELRTAMMASSSIAVACFLGSSSASCAAIRFIAG